MNHAAALDLVQRTPALDDLSQTDWDVVVVGAGPAGAAAAIGLAQLGRRVLLVEAKAFPRDKVCGGCLNARAWNQLQQLGVDQALLQAGAVRLETMRLVSGRHSAAWQLPEMTACSRRLLDALLIQHAQQQGVAFVDQTSARVLGGDTGNHRQVELAQADGRRVRLQPRVVICADGLNHSSLRSLGGFESVVSQLSRVGLGANLPATGVALPAGQLTMVIDRVGYVGIAGIEDNRISVAAAVESRALAGHARPAELIVAILNRAGIDCPASWHEANWLGTPGLTRRTGRVADRRLFVIGDAAGYVEPFTGEGIAWALESAAMVVPMVDAACSAWKEALASAWTESSKKEIVGSQWMCRLLTKLLRRPQLAALAMTGCRMVPAVPRYVLRRINRPVANLPSAPLGQSQLH